MGKGGKGVLGARTQSAGRYSYSNAALDYEHEHRFAEHEQEAQRSDNPIAYAMVTPECATWRP